MNLLEVFIANNGFIFSGCATDAECGVFDRCDAATQTCVANTAGKWYITKLQSMQHKHRCIYWTSASSASWNFTAYYGRYLSSQWQLSSQSPATYLNPILPLYLPNCRCETAKRFVKPVCNSLGRFTATLPCKISYSVLCFRLYSGVRSKPGLRATQLRRRSYTCIYL